DANEPTPEAPPMTDQQRQRINQLVTGLKLTAEYFSKRLTQLVGKANWQQLTAPEAARVLGRLEKALREGLGNAVATEANAEATPEARTSARARAVDLKALIQQSGPAVA